MLSSSDDLDILDSILESQERRFAMLTDMVSDKRESTAAPTSALLPLLSKIRRKNVTKRKSRGSPLSVDNADEFEVGCTIPSSKPFDFNDSCEKVKAREEESATVKQEGEEEDELSLFDYEIDFPFDATRRLHGSSPGGLSHCSTLGSPQSLTKESENDQADVSEYHDTINILSSTGTCRSNLPPRGNGSGRLSLTFCDEDENIIVRVPVERGLTFFGGEHHDEDAAEWGERPANASAVAALAAVYQRRKEFCLALRSFAEIVESDDDEEITKLPSKTTKAGEEEGVVTPPVGAEDKEAPTTNQSEALLENDLTISNTCRADVVGLAQPNHRQRQIFSIFDIPVDTVVNTKTLSVHELREELKARGQSVEGTKSDLVRRLDKYLVANESLLLVNSRNRSSGELHGQVKGRVSKKSSSASMTKEALVTTTTTSCRSSARKRLREPYGEGEGVGADSESISTSGALLSSSSSTWRPRSARGQKLRAKNMSAADAVESFLASL